VPRTWGGSLTPARTRRVEGLVRRMLATMAPELSVEFRYTIDTWEWRYRGSIPSHVRERIDMALHLLAIRWRRIEEETAAGTAEPAALLAEWDHLVLRFVAGDARGAAATVGAASDGSRAATGSRISCLA
jgi:hypothetical protein